MEELYQVMSSHVALSAAAWEATKTVVRRRSYRKKAYIYQANHIWREIFFIQTGCIRHYYTLANGEDVTCDFSMEGAFLTDFLSLNQQTPSQYNYLTLEETELISFQLDDLLHLYSTFPEIERFGRLMAEKAANRVSLMAHSLLMDSPEERYKKLLEEKKDLIKRVPQKFIAHYLGIKPESLSRIRKRISQNQG
ncbi:MAG: Crp/Fnr family transcriptional regulator [Bacteroidota bacterium]